MSIARTNHHTLRADKLDSPRDYQQFIDASGEVFGACFVVVCPEMPDSDVSLMTSADINGWANWAYQHYHGPWESRELTVTDIIGESKG